MEVLLHLSLIEKVGPAAVLGLIKSFELSKQSLNDIYLLSVAELQQRGLLTLEKAQLVYHGLRSRILLDKELQLIEKSYITYTTIADQHYPEMLKNTHLPPIVLYSKGAGALASQNHIAVVGSRAADRYGYTIVKTFVPEMVKQGWAIVSGGALGIDTAAHQAALDAGGITIAVIGSGLLRAYPPQNADLFKKIIDSGGTLVSPFPLLMEALPGNFPARNRIIAGLARGCLVVQAAAKSGALITAQYALNEGRDVFAVPGAIDNPLSAGCHSLISQGATIATSAADVLIAFGQEGTQMRIDQAIQAPTKLLDPFAPETKLLRMCAQPVSFDELRLQMGLNDLALQDLLCDLSLEGKVAQNRIGLWQCL